MAAFGEPGIVPTKKSGLDAGRLDRVVAQAECAIASQLARRTVRRLGLPEERTSNPTQTRILLFFCRRSIPLLSRFVRVLFNSDIQSRLPSDVLLPHPYGIIVHPQAVIGRRVTLMQQVTIGGRDHRENIAPLINGKYRMGDVRHCFADIGRARSLIGFNPQVRLEQGIVELANWLEGQQAEDHFDRASEELTTRGLTV